jgi:TRAP-type C4-dicarboxylate transport system permease large subunit
LALIIVLVPILAPVALHFGIDPVPFDLVMVVNLALGMITPPVGVNPVTLGLRDLVYR